MESRPVQTSWFDLGALGQLKGSVAADKAGALSAATQHFESLFLGMLLKEMRKTVPESGLLKSDALDTYQQMFDQQVALSLSRAGGIGLAKQLASQLGPPPAPAHQALVGAPAGTEAPAALPTTTALRRFGVKER